MAATKWVIDPAHSEIQFKVRHLVISNVTGSFKKFTGSVSSSTGSFEDAAAEVVIEVNSINTNEANRDAHLLSNDFFNAAEFPEITFTSTSIQKQNEEEFKISGNLAMHGVTKAVELKAVFGGTQSDMYGNRKSGFEVSGEINRKDFGVAFNALTETGSIVVGDTVKLTADIQLTEQKEAAE